MPKPLLLFAMILISGSVCSQTLTDQDWSSEEDFRVVEPVVTENIIWLENHPLATPENDTKALTAYVLNWISEVPYLEIEYNELFISQLSNSKRYKFGEKFRVTYLFGKSYYLIENPGDDDEAKASARGIEGMVTVYGELLKTDPSVRNSLLEKYSRLVKKGRTVEYTQSMLDKASKKTL